LQPKTISQLRAELRYILADGAGNRPKVQWLCDMMLIVNGADDEVGEMEVAGCCRDEV